MYSIEQVINEYLPDFLNQIKKSVSQENFIVIDNLFKHNLSKKDYGIFLLNLKIVKRYLPVLETLFQNFWEKNLFFFEGKNARKFLFVNNIETLLAHQEYLREQYKNSPIQSTTLFKTKIFSTFDGNRDEDIELHFNISADITQESCWAFELRIQSWEKEIFNCGFYKWDKEIFISSIQSFYGTSDYFFVVKFHKIAFKCISILWKKWNIDTIRMYTNATHPARFWNEHSGFMWNYDNLASSYSLEVKKYFHSGNISPFDTKLPKSILQNLEVQFSKIKI